MLTSKLDTLVVGTQVPTIMKDEGILLEKAKNGVLYYQARKPGSTRQLRKSLPISSIIAYEVSDDKKLVVWYLDTNTTLGRGLERQATSDVGGFDLFYRKKDSAKPSHLYTNNQYCLSVLESAKDDSGKKKSGKKTDKAAAGKAKAEKTEKKRRNK